MKRYLNKISASLSVFLLLSFLIIGNNKGYAQVKKDFKPRESANAPKPYTNVKNYNIQGDFTMIGNTNLTLRSYSDSGENGGNNKEMIYVDIDKDKKTKNSSSAKLVLPGGECTEIVYAGLYWTGRAHDGNSWGGGDQSPIAFGGFDKRKVKLKAQDTSYVEITAKDTDIYYPNTTEGVMYAAYADVTDYVRQHGSSNYFVADIALKEGSGGGTGFYGGWGMVIIYKNTSMAWRDITVFDGYAYVAGGSYKYELPISGFKASQYGNVNVTLGMMAGEGDENISGDYFEIKKNKDFVKLKHNGNTTDNFFNSSITVGDTPRNPNLVNNTGFDIAKFDLDNAGNKYIGNNSTSTTFRYGSKQDTYIIFNMVFAVDAYVPDVVGENKTTIFNGTKPLNNGTIDPGQEFEFELDVFNKGTEAVNNSKIEIPVPFNLHYTGSTIQSGLSAGGTVKWIPPVGGTTNSLITAGGTIVWEIGTLPLDTTKEKLLAQLKYRFKVSDDCILLSTNVCGLEVRVNGKISGTGATSETKVSSDLVREYDRGVCAGPVYDDFMSIINLSETFLQKCNPPVENKVMQFRAFCNVSTSGFERSKIIDKYPVGTKFFNVVPTSYSSSVGVVTGDFPVNADGSKKMYYAMTPGMSDSCYVKLEVSVDIVVTEPTVKDITVCYGEVIVLENSVSKTGVNNQYQLVYFDSDNNLISGVPNPDKIGIHTYFVAEGKDGCIGLKKKFTITITELPEVSKEVKDILLCENFDSETIFVTTNATNYNWEYSTIASQKWNKLDNTSFSSVVIIQDNKIKVSHATKELNGVRIRLNVTNNQCSDQSNDFIIKVNDCSGVTNPMLLNQGISN